MDAVEGLVEVVGQAVGRGDEVVAAALACRLWFADRVPPARSAGWS